MGGRVDGEVREGGQIICSRCSVIVGRVKGGKGGGDGLGPLSKLGSIGTRQAARVLSGLHKLLDIKSKAVDGASRGEAAGKGGDVKEVRPPSGEKGNTALAENRLTLIMIDGWHGGT